MRPAKATDRCADPPGAAGGRGAGLIRLGRCGIVAGMRRGERIGVVRQKLPVWWEGSKRDMPWRRSSAAADPYAI
ncbi:unnamed protein product, partial [marine sediment metagenome]